jgi:hypothetical protein
MIHNSDREAARLRKTLGWYNMLPNIFWSVICLLPLTVFCYTLLPPVWFFVFLVLGFVPVFLPNSFFDKMQVGKTTVVYKRLGVEMVNRLAQNGELVNRQVRKKFPGYQAVTPQHASVHKRIQQTYVYEKFHFLLFVFFTLSMLYALGKEYFGWAAVLLVTNLFYNVYPNLLQQYIRLKLKAYARKHRVGGAAHLPKGR